MRMKQHALHQERFIFSPDRFLELHAIVVLFVCVFSYFCSFIGMSQHAIFLSPHQLNQSQSSVAGLVEVLSGKRRLWALGELAAIESGYRQAVELKHSYPQVCLR